MLQRKAKRSKDDFIVLAFLICEFNSTAEVAISSNLSSVTLRLQIYIK